MGFPKRMFAKPISNSIICMMCNEIIQNATSCFGCGHTFCEHCIKSHLESKNSCPTCHQHVISTAPNYLARAMINEMKVVCPNNDKETTSKEMNPSKRRKTSDDLCSSINEPISKKNLRCTWEAHGWKYWMHR